MKLQSMLCLNTWGLGKKKYKAYSAARRAKSRIWPRIHSFHCLFPPAFFIVSTKPGSFCL